MTNKDWTWDDYEYLYRNYNIVPVKEIAKKLDRSVSSVISHAEKLLLVPKSEFSKSDLALARNYGSQLGTALVFMLPEYSTPKVEELIQCAANT